MYRITWGSEIANAIYNLRQSIQPGKSQDEIKEHYSQAVRSAGIAAGAMIQNINQYMHIDPNVNRLNGRATGAFNALQVQTRLADNVFSLISEHEDGVVDLGKMQAVLADSFALASYALEEKNPVAAGILNVGSAAITAASIAYPGGKMSTEDFYNADNWKGFIGELGADLLNKGGEAWDKAMADARDTILPELLPKEHNSLFNKDVKLPDMLPGADDGNPAIPTPPNDPTTPPTDPNKPNNPSSDNPQAPGTPDNPNGNKPDSSQPGNPNNAGDPSHPDADKPQPGPIPPDGGFPSANPPFPGPLTPPNSGFPNIPPILPRLFPQLFPPRRGFWLPKDPNDRHCYAPWLNLPRGKYHLVDPLALDLDGDGIETISANGLSGSLFDHNKDGIRTATGWLSADDGFLVLDRNNNGIIDNGGELFGDSTELKDGTTAAHGYAALAELDDNNDGIISTDDAAFAALRVWRDLNQDGISQENELSALTDAGIQSLNTAYTEPNRDLGNGNRLLQEGSYTDTEGNSRQTGDLGLRVDSLYSRHTDPVELTVEQFFGPNLQGTGRLRDLREAAALSPELAESLKTYAEADSKEAQTELLADLVQKWAATDSNPTNFNSSMLLSTGSMIRTANEGIALTPSEERAMLAGLSAVVEKVKPRFDAVSTEIGILDAFTGERSTFFSFATEAQADQVIDTAKKTLNDLSNNIYKGLLFQTRLLSYINQIGLKAENGELVLDYAGMLAEFEKVHKENPQKAFVDLAEFIAYGSHAENNQDNSVVTELSSLLNKYMIEAEQQGVLADYSKLLDQDAWKTLGFIKGDDQNNNLTGNDLSNYLTGNTGNDHLYGANGNDVLNGGEGDDYLVGGDGNDRINGEEGSDSLVGDSGDDTLSGGESDDKLYGGDGSDTLDGGAGNDRLEGGDDADTYLFAKGHGNDIVSDYDSHVGNMDTLRFEGILSSEVQFIRDGNDLVLSGYQDSDSVRIGSFFNSQGHKIERFVFDDIEIENPDFAVYLAQADQMIQTMSIFGHGSEVIGSEVQVDPKPVLLAASV